MSKAMERVMIILFISVSSFASDTLTATESLNSIQTLISSGQKYELGFFTPAGAQADKLYLGIWYYDLPVEKTVVWVANRDAPANSSSSILLKFLNNGQIGIVEQGVQIWFSNNSSIAINPVLQLLDTGNLVLREATNDNEDDYLWQSFDYPTDTLLPNQKLGWDKISGLNRHLVSWKSQNDPTSGNFSFKLTLTGDPEIFLLQGETKRIYRTGPLVGLGLSGVPAMKPSTQINYTLPDTPDEIYYMFILLDKSIKSRLTVESDGVLYRYTWLSDLQEWNPYWHFPQEPCDNYMYCGTYGVCDSANCDCPQGFDPRDPREWGLRDGSKGCVRRTKLECGTDGFVALSNMKLPMSGTATVDRGKNLDECRMMCKRNCNCTAYSNAIVLNGEGSGCVMWTGDLLDMTSFKDGGQDLYIRLAAADLGTTNSKTKKLVIGLSILFAAVTLLVAIVSYLAWKKTKHTKTADAAVSRPTATTISNKRELSAHNNSPDDLELPFYEFDAIVTATNDFANENKIGEGGFGSVFKGVLNEGEEIAVKRLSKESGQGAEEFKNEVNLIAKLQHRNLVRLLGYSNDRDEKVLIYEYLRNRSLDYVLFHKERRLLLDWRRRFNIICGIARGLLYLHHDSRLRIIHRDLKASNILLDDDLNPKISDFGMARIFKGDETDANNTRRVVGTYGYMSPEYAMDGIFSMKSDVFSFGVLVLEIVVGKKNREFCNLHQELNLLGYAWKKWEEGDGTGLIDPSIEDSCVKHEALKCIQIGLLCVQAQPKERPTMSSVVLLLSTENASLPRPKLLGFYLDWRPRASSSGTESYPSQKDESSYSNNQVTVTMIDGR